MAEDSKLPDEQRLIRQLLGWGTASLFIFAGWMINPNTTHHITTIGTDAQGRIIEIDRISVRGNEGLGGIYDDAEARGRGWAVLVIGGLAGAFWLCAVWNVSERLSESKDAKRYVVTRCAARIHALVVCFLLLLLLMFIVDVI